MNVGGTVDLCDFEIEVGIGSGREYPIAVLRSPAGEIRQKMLFPLDDLALESRLQSLEIALLRSGNKRRQILTPEEENVKNFGRQLFDILFSGEIRTMYDLSRETARRQGKGLRVKLRFNAPEIASLPWEFLFDVRQSEYICLSRDTPIVRYLELPQVVAPFKIKPPLRILGMVSSPSGLPQLDIENEKKRVQNALTELHKNNVVELTWLEGQTWRDIQRVLRKGEWHIFHFIGHGGFDKDSDQGIIALADENGFTHRLLASELSRLLADHHSLRLVVLNSCESGRGSERDIFSSTASILVRRGIPAVLAMQYAITDIAAIEFSRAFYEALADGFPVDIAICEARKAVSLAVYNSVEWGMPVLYMRSPDGKLFDIADNEKKKYFPETQLTILYNNALEAMSRNDWQEAKKLLAEIHTHEPGYRDITTRISQVDKKLEFANQLNGANEKMSSGEWQQAVEILEQLSLQEPNNSEINELLETARKWVDLSDLYTTGCTLMESGKPEEALRIFNEIQSKLPGYLEVAEKIKELNPIVVENERRFNFYRDFMTAKEKMVAGDWYQAELILNQLATQEPNNSEVSKSIKEVKKRVGLADLYKVGQEKLKAGDENGALKIFRDVERQSPGYRDVPEQINILEQIITEKNRKNKFKSDLESAKMKGRLGEWRKAQELLNMLKLQEPSNHEVINLLADANTKVEMLNLYEYGQSKLKAGDNEGAYKIFMDLSTRFPGFRDVAQQANRLKQLLYEEEQKKRKGIENQRNTYKGDYQNTPEHVSTTRRTNLTGVHAKHSEKSLGYKISLFIFKVFIWGCYFFLSYSIGFLVMTILSEIFYSVFYFDLIDYFEILMYGIPVIVTIIGIPFMNTTMKKINF